MAEELASTHSIADGITPDPRCARPQVEVFEALQQSKDPPLIRKYGLWLVKRDMNAGLMVSPKMFQTAITREY